MAIYQFEKDRIFRNQIQRLSNNQTTYKWFSNRKTWLATWQAEKDLEFLDSKENSCKNLVIGEI
tara:strand:+ start:350 stop:541 length:192 start_codon:yes stop_codon:yes gene_type:complete